MKFLEKLSKKIGFTKTETNVIIFILTAFLIGLSLNIVKDIKNEKTYLEFNYKKEDSLFYSSSVETAKDKVILDKEEKKIDSKRELLDFTKENKNITRSEKSISPGKVININTAGVSELVSLPGIGQKTAEGIIEYRNKNGRIKDSIELLKIKGIGKSKLNKIKDWIIFD